MNEKLDFGTLSPKQQVAVRILGGMNPGAKLMANRRTFAVTTGQSLVRKGWAYHEYGQGFGNARAFYSLTEAGRNAYELHLDSQSPSIVLPAITADAPALDHPALTEWDKHIAEKTAYAAYRTAPEVGDNAYMTFQEWQRDRQRLAEDAPGIRLADDQTLTPQDVRLAADKRRKGDIFRTVDELRAENADLRARLEAAQTEIARLHANFARNQAIIDADEETKARFWASYEQDALKAEVEAREALEKQLDALQEALRVAKAALERVRPQAKGYLVLQDIDYATAKATLAIAAAAAVKGKGE